jgi:hypothetical protein
MRSSHAATAVDIAFDGPNLIGDGGLGQVVTPAEYIGVSGLVADRVTISGAGNSGGANAGAKVMTLLAGMVAGADRIQDADRLRLGASTISFDGENDNSIWPHCDGLIWPHPGQVGAHRVNRPAAGPPDDAPLTRPSPLPPPRSAAARSGGRYDAACAGRLILDQPGRTVS